MDVTFYVFMGFLVGIAVMCGLVIAVSVKDQPPARTNRSPHDPLDNSDRVVYKKKKDGSRGEKVGCTDPGKEPVKKYLAALYANANEGKKMKLSKEFIKELIQETLTPAKKKEKKKLEKDKKDIEKKLDKIHHL